MRSVDNVLRISGGVTIYILVISEAKRLTCFNNLHFHPLEAYSRNLDCIMHQWSNPFFGVFSNQALKVLTFLVNQAAEIKPLKA